MITKLIDTAQSLTKLMRDETKDLEERGRHADHEEIANAKGRLAAALEVEIARLNRETPDWQNDLDTDQRSELALAMQDLRDAAAVNQEILGRHLELSNQLIAAVTDEAKRVTGNGGISYQSSGAIAAADKSAPISVNTSL